MVKWNAGVTKYKFRAQSDNLAIKGEQEKAYRPDDLDVGDRTNSVSQGSDRGNYAFGNRDSQVEQGSDDEDGRMNYKFAAGG